ncbi:DUF2515 domain-containing protein [Mesobacillus maritimus]|uniref:DUF2515 domain-containing protein n=1 Tax=Mesobacillus maritimus TaxID=1643336 RepID=A0ABS7K1D6_9BACI|nr:DUF2515 domain-containing protein [Mesobacillus maritimus]
MDSRSIHLLGGTILNLLKKAKTKPLSPSLVNIKKELKRKSKKAEHAPKLLPKEALLIQTINSRTRRLNKNNVTRTKAYLDFYKKFPEIHWAFLGHMVSRNGGYNMTDLKGGFLTKLMTGQERKNFFAFLERGNWLIFQDAYPQFLLYEESIKTGKNLFYLLPYLNVSLFMETIWSHFWQQRDSSILTLGLIMNEQNYLETRVIQDPIYKKIILDSLEFKLQDILSMNHILFPYENSGKIQLIGATLHHFERLQERILLGKRLYKVLFDDSQLLEKIVQWAYNTPHTGSRMDYWPQLFHYVDEGVPGLQWKPRIVACKLTSGSPRIYSPQLELAWKNQEHESAEIGDWFHDWKVVYDLQDTEEKISGEIQYDYCRTIEKLELATYAKKAISILE